MSVLATTLVIPLSGIIPREVIFDILRTLGITQTFVRILVFIGFFAIAAVAIYFNRHRELRSLFVGTFIFLFLAVPFVGTLIWPFYPFLLFTQPGPEHVSINQVRLADAQGNEISYDARAIEPANKKISRHYANQMLRQYSEEQTYRMGMYMLEKGQTYREVDQNQPPPIWERARFPKHFLGYQWSPETLEGVGEFTELRVYKLNATIAKDGQRVLSETEQLVLVVNESGVYHPNGDPKQAYLYQNETYSMTPPDRSLTADNKVGGAGA